MSAVLTLGPPPIRTPLDVADNAVVIREGSPFGKWLNLVSQILKGVGPLLAGYGAPALRLSAVMLPLDNVPVFANNAAALLGGLIPGHLYRTGGDPDYVAIVH